MNEQTNSLNQPWMARLACAMALCASSVCMAQGLRLGGPALAPSLSPTTANTTGARSSDFIVAVVDSEPITNQELQQQVEQTAQQLQQQQGSLLISKNTKVREATSHIESNIR
jgi:peptidyl-prolyl cis-trans isomerase SurA